MVQHFATILPPVPASHMMISHRINIREEDERKKEKEIESE